MATMQSTVSTVPRSTPYCHSAKNYCQNLVLLDGLGDNDTIIYQKQAIHIGRVVNSKKCTQNSTNSVTCI